MLTIAPLKRWSIKYYNATARRRGGRHRHEESQWRTRRVLLEGKMRALVWICAGDAAGAAKLAGLSDADRAGGQAHLDVVARWLDDGIALNGAYGRAFGRRDNHGFDLTFAAAKSVSLLRTVGDDVTQKAVTAAHATAVSEALSRSSWPARLCRRHPGAVHQDRRAGPGDADRAAAGIRRLRGRDFIAFGWRTDRRSRWSTHNFPPMPSLVCANSSSGVHLRNAGITVRACHVEGRRADRSGHATADEATLLGIKPKSALLLITRITYDQNGTPCEFSRDLFRGDRTALAVTAQGRGIATGRDANTASVTLQSQAV